MNKSINNNKKYANPQLYKYLKDYTQKAIKILKENIAVDAVPVKKWIKWFHHSENNYVKDIGIEKLWFLNIHKYKAALHKLKAYSKLQELLNSTFVSEGRLDTLIGTINGGTRIDKDTIIDHILYRIVAGSGKLLFKLNKFNSYYILLRE